jgi:hypothetical protein
MAEASIALGLFSDHGRPPVSLQINASDGANSTPTVRVDFVSPKPEVELDALLDTQPTKDISPAR